jgi:hypothetical protein
MSYAYRTEFMSTRPSAVPDEIGRNPEQVSPLACSIAQAWLRGSASGRIVPQSAAAEALCLRVVK